MVADGFKDDEKLSTKMRRQIHSRLYGPGGERITDFEGKDYSFDVYN